MKNINLPEEDIYDPTDDLDESETIYEGGEPEPGPSEECYDYDEFLSVEETLQELKKTNDNPWISVGVIASVISFCMFMFWLFL